MPKRKNRNMRAKKQNGTCAVFLPDLMYQLLFVRELKMFIYMFVCERAVVINVCVGI